MALTTPPILTPIELIAHRKLIGLTQHALGEAFGVSRVTISRWEHGHEAIPLWVPLALRTLQQEYFASVAHLMPVVLSGSESPRR